MVSALILAGGQSSRMGQDKASLSFSGIPLLRRVYDVAAHCTESVSVITPWPERYQALLPAACQWIVERSPNGSRGSTQGPVVGFSHGLRYLMASAQLTPWVLLLACDLPCLEVEVLIGWMGDLSSVDPLAIAALPCRASSQDDVHPNPDKQWEPLCGFYRASCVDSLQEFIAGGGRSFQRWLRNEQIEALDMGDRRAQTMLMNCNTPDDLSAIQNRHHDQPSRIPD
ncbi:MAG: molybdenum cofactor guanylyltransferase [Cyanobacteria bacterium P01_A01_bin.37]